MNGKLIGATMVAFFSVAATAGSIGPINDNDNEQAIRDNCAKVITLSMGPAFYNNSGDIQTNISLINRSVNRYVPVQVSGTVGTGELFFGLAQPISRLVSGQAGIAIAYSGNGKRSGYIYQSNPLNRYAYSYSTSSGRIAMKGKLIGEVPYWIKPYVAGSAGIGFNRSWDYLTSRNATTLGVPLFGDSTTNGFSYTAGLGLQTNINSYWQVGIGYEFADWGKSSLGLPAYPSGGNRNVLYKGPHAANFYTQEVQFSLSYFM